MGIDLKPRKQHQTRREGAYASNGDRPVVSMAEYASQGVHIESLGAQRDGHFLVHLTLITRVCFDRAHLF